MTSSDSHSFTEIPRINLALADDPQTKGLLLSQLRHALLNIGFLYIENHGIPQKVIDDMIQALPTLFSMSADAKAQVALSNSPHFLGYSSAGTETTAGKPDHREQFEYATELPATWAPGAPLYERLRGPNPWPPTTPPLRPIIETYIAALTSLGTRFLHLVAPALSLPRDALLPFLSDQHRLKLVRYPPVPSSAGEGTAQGVGPHKDSSGWLTFLLQASPPHVRGLQVLAPSGAWLDVPPVPGTLVVNVGQALEVVTAGACAATVHRVLAGPEERFSVPFFQGVRGSLTRSEAVGALGGHFRGDEFRRGEGEAEERKEVDSPFLKGRYETWGESQLRTKIRSHRDVGRRFYGDVFERYVNDD